MDTESVWECVCVFVAKGVWCLYVYRGGLIHFISTSRNPLRKSLGPIPLFRL